MKTNVSRRDFMKGAVAGALTLSAAGILGACSADTAAETTTASSAPTTAQAESAPVVTETITVEPVLTELEIPEAEAPAQTEYTCDVLVVGGGFAGLFAALEAKEAGANVLLVDKGRPGYSGLSAWASSHCYFDADLGDSKENFEYAMKYANEWRIQYELGRQMDRGIQVRLRKVRGTGYSESVPDCCRGRLLGGWQHRKRQAV